MPSKFPFALFLIFSLQIGLAWPKDSSKTLDKAIEESKKRPLPDQQCHVCHSETEDACFNFTNQPDEFEGFPDKCPQDSRICVVKKFAFTSTDKNGTTTPMKTFSVKRNCTNKCEDGCVVMGERTRLYVCSSCCTTPLCNTGSGASSLHHFRYSGVSNNEFYVKPKIRAQYALLTLVHILLSTQHFFVWRLNTFQHSE